MLVWPSVKLLFSISLSGFFLKKEEFYFVKLASCLLTRTKENDGFEVGIFIRVWGQLDHAVTELLHPPDVLHY